MAKETYQHYNEERAASKTNDPSNDRFRAYQINDAGQAAWNDHRQASRNAYVSHPQSRNKNWDHNYSTQDVFLRRAIRTGETQILTLKHNVCVTGNILSYDNWSLLVYSEGKERLIFKSAISDIVSE